MPLAAGGQVAGCAVEDDFASVHQRHLVEDVGAACAQVALMDRGRIIFHGAPGDLAARGEGHDTGDAPLERGYSAVLAAARP